MKPIYLEMNYFGPHAHSEIDFRALDEAPLFLISGDTGAGKSTIFDAMTYALFDKTTGDREAREMRSQFAQPDQRTEVTFYFEQGNFLYKVQRCPEQEVFKKRGTGTKTEKSQARLAIVDKVFGTEQASLATKPVDVASEIYGLLNLSAEQFKKIILLPQNDFSRFLKSATNEKEEILKKIFGTAIFTVFSEEVRHQYTKNNQENAALDSILQSQYSSSVWTEEEAKALDECPENEKFKKATEFLEQKQLQESNARDLARIAQQQVEAADKAYEEALLLEQEFLEAEKAQKEYQEKIVEQAALYEQQKKAYGARSWAQQFKDILRDLEEVEKEREANEVREAEYRLKAEQEQKTLGEVKKHEQDLGQKASVFEEKDKAIEELTRAITQAEQAEKLIRQKKDFEKKVVHLQLQKRETDAPLKEAQTKLEQLQKELLEEGVLQAEKDALSRLKLDFHQQLSPLAEYLERLKQENQGAQEDLNLAEENITKLEQEFMLKQESYQEKRKLRQSLMIAQLQKELEDGLPCKVCGAIEHPLAQAKLDVSDSDLKEAMQQVDKAQEAFAAAEERQEKAQSELERTQKKAAEKAEALQETQQKFDQAYRQFCQTHEGCFPEVFNRQELSNIFQAREDSYKQKSIAQEEGSLEKEKLCVLVEKIEAERQALVQESDKVKAQLETVVQSLAEFGQLQPSQTLKEQKVALRQEVNNYYMECQEVREKIVALEKRYAEQKAKHDERLTRIEEQKLKIQEGQGMIQKALAAPNAWTNDLATLKKWLSEDKLPEISKFINTYELEEKRLNRALAEYEEKLRDKQRPHLTKLREEKQALNARHSQTQKTVVELSNTRQQLETTVAKIKQVLETQGKAADKAREITKLYNAVAGKSGDKLKLETFVVQHYLEKVLIYANQHFINQLSNNRYRFELAKESANKRRDHGLDISIYDNETGASRSSNTLSGGETFIAALSIALALSEVVQNSAQGVQIEALFVDEGFGSLDQETLQKAMTALEQIGENRLVGLISHVEEMKDSIAQQLRVEKVGDGRSQVKLFSK
ncbi:SbcC/MukB-like Walker B domain-containing protein [Lactococcus garvieae]|uniref:Nuclease SbcCD subunit C n=1 Tax=Lactococcus garvieae TaxID=1363 RepID=A0A1I4GP16_9LACT|nr:SMC family ATPase [Lactococcus garvieae]SFL31233.1 exonuclease SbcC [Lactococcus garvieae]